MIHTGEDRKRLTVRCLNDMLRSQDLRRRDSASPIRGYDRADLAARTAVLFEQLDCGMGLLALHEFVAGLFEAYRQTDGSDGGWVCNSALLAHMLPQLRCVFPDARMVHVIRPDEQAFPMSKTFAARFPGHYYRVHASSLDDRAETVVQHILAWVQTTRPASTQPRAA